MAVAAMEEAAMEVVVTEIEAMEVEPARLDMEEAVTLDTVARPR